MKLTGLTNHAIRQYNKSIILSWLYKKKIANQSTLGKISNLTIPTVNSILQEMIKEQTVSQSEENNHQNGQRRGYYQISAKDGHILCINVSPHQIESILVDHQINPISKLLTQIITLSSPQQLISQLIKIYKQYIRLHPKQSIRLAIAIYGQVNSVSGTTQTMPQAGWKQPIEIKYLLEKTLATTVLVDNNCVMLALAEKWLNSKDHHDFCIVDLDYCISSSFVINQQIYRGNLFASGQIGHTILDPNGLACKCGRNGCLEALASLDALKQHCQKSFNLAQDQPSIEWIFEQFNKKNGDIQNWVFKSAELIGLSLYNYLNTLNINHFYLYGHSCKFGQTWLDTIMKQMRLNPFDHQDHVQANKTRIHLGTLPRSQQIMGIAYLYVELQLFKL